MQSRIKNPLLMLPGVYEGLRKVAAAVGNAGIPETTHFLVQLRASQINGCSVCVDMHSRELAHAGEPAERISCVAAWREAPYYTDAERAALALAEAVTRLADRPDPVPDEIWDEAAHHYDEKQLAALVVSIAVINVYNRVNAATRQPSGEHVEQFIRKPRQSA
jgi:AhpD family alkylhydroperoxidase